MLGMIHRAGSISEAEHICKRAMKTKEMFISTREALESKLIESIECFIAKRREDLLRLEELEQWSRISKQEKEMNEFDPSI